MGGLAESLQRESTI